MPREIENYVHRIGRTGRGGRKGIATTFLGQNCQETILLDLRGLLLEAKQHVPEFLMRLSGDVAGFSAMGQASSSALNIGAGQGCVYCGGLGHRILDCPKLESERRKQLGSATSADLGGAF